MSCPYYNASHVRIEETKAAIIVGLQTENEKLQAQINDMQTAKTPRAMTLEEAAVSDFCYVEYSTGDIIPAFVRFAVMAGEIKSYKIQTDLGHSYFCADKYGKILRCWNSGPSDEQREAVKWE